MIYMINKIENQSFLYSENLHRRRGEDSLVQVA